LVTTGVVERMADLSRAVASAQGRIDPETLAQADDVLRRVRERQRLPEGHTVVAIAGATGVGKSALFNALSGLDLATVGVRRPTTEEPLACVWGSDGVRPLLDWLDIPRRHRLNRESALDLTSRDDDLQGLVLLDLPGHDSLEIEQQATVDRLIGLADLVVWVVDPTKYADESQNVYLERFKEQENAVVVAFNRADTVPSEATLECMEDLRKLMAETGLPDLRVVATSTRTGQGIAELRSVLGERVVGQQATEYRLTAELKHCADWLASLTGENPARSLAGPDKARAMSAFAVAAGVPVIVAAVTRSFIYRAWRKTAWPPLLWLAKLRPDPLTRLFRALAKGLARQSKQQLGEGGMQSPEIARTAPTEPVPVQRTRVDQTARRIVGVAATGLGKPWETALRESARMRMPELSDELDRAVEQTDLGVADQPGWWAWVQRLQWVLLAGAVTGGVWTLALALTGTPRSSTPPVLGASAPMFLLVFGVISGLLVTWIARMAAGSDARKRGMEADKRLRTSIASVADARLFTPVQKELGAYMTCREALNGVRHGR
jgi:small GTP-binding protein